MRPRRRLGDERLVPGLPAGLAHRFSSLRGARPRRRWAAERWCFAGARVFPSPCKWAFLCFYALHKDSFHLLLHLNLFYLSLPFFLIFFFKFILLVWFGVLQWGFLFF